MNDYKKTHHQASNPDRQLAAGKGAIQLQDNRAKTVADGNNVVQFVTKKNTKLRAGIPEKSKPGTPEKQQSETQRAYNAYQSYRKDFFNEYDVKLHHIVAYVLAGNKLHGHGSKKGKTDSKENNATKEDADAFVGWFRRKYLND